MSFSERLAASNFCRIFLWILLQWMPMACHGYSNRYFGVETVLPPLEPLQPPDRHNKKNMYSKPLRVLYTNDPKLVTEWLDEHIREPKIIGFDVESVPNLPWIERTTTVRGPTVVQLATATHACVIQLMRKDGRPSKACVPILDAILADDSIIKTGVSIHNDCVELYEYFGIESRSRLDLAEYVRVDKGRNTPGLKRLAASILGVDLPKPKRISRSNWSRVPLTSRQVAYAAWDAWVAVAIAQELLKHSPPVDLLERPVRDLFIQQKRRRNLKAMIQEWKMMDDSELKTATVLLLKKELRQMRRDLVPYTVFQAQNMTLG